MKKAKAKKSVRKAKKPPRRIVIGTGYPWFFFNNKHLVKGHPVSAIGLTKGEKTFFDWATLDPKGSGNWNRVWLVIEVLK